MAGGFASWWDHLPVWLKIPVGLLVLALVLVLLMAGGAYHTG